MLNLFKELSLVPKGLRYKTMIAFSLMSLIPILICSWLVITYIFPNINLFLGLSLGNISFILVISIFISLLGLYLTKEMIDPVIKMSVDAKIIAEGDVTRTIAIDREDEVGDLSKSLNLMTQKIKENMEELRAYGEKTRLINMEINKKVLALSSLLEIGNLISTSKDLDSILDFILQRISDVETHAVSFLMLMDEAAKEYRAAFSVNLNEELGRQIKLKPNNVSQHIVCVDRDTPAKAEFLINFLALLGLKNVVFMPILITGRLYGILVVGNSKDDFTYADDEKELLKVFTKQIAIAIENDMLIKKSKELAVKDEITGLYNLNYIKARLDEEIKRAIIYQRPCGYLLIDVDEFKGFATSYGEEQIHILLRGVGGIVKSAVTEIDKVGRLGDDKFSVILPEKNKRQCANIAEDIRKSVEDNIPKVIKFDRKITVSIGVSENPIDGSSSAELMEKAERLVRTAKSLGKNRVVV